METHTNVESNTDMKSQAAAQGFSVDANVAMQYSNTMGNHVGEAVFASKFTYSIPIEPEIIESAESCNDIVRRFASMEIRFGQTSILCVAAYFWCSEGLSHRNWAIFQ